MHSKDKKGTLITKRILLGQSDTYLHSDTLPIGLHPMAGSFFSNPGDGNLIPARFHTFREIDHEIISTAIIFLFADS